MVKLVRLTSTDNGVFKSSFANDMLIKPNSKLALLNLTFKTDIATLIIDDTNNLIITYGNYFQIPLTIGTAKLTNAIYEGIQSIIIFEYDVLRALNESLSFSNITTGVLRQGSNVTSSAYRIFKGEGGKNEIDWKYAPFINPLNDDTTQEPEPQHKWMVVSSTVTVDSTTALTTIVSAAAEPATVLRTKTILCEPGHSLSPGNGLHMIRINNSVDNGSGIADNGGGIGLTNVDFVKDNIRAGADLTPKLLTSVIRFEIIYNRPTDTYKYIDTVDGTIKDSLVTPVNVNSTTEPDLAIHDVMFIDRNNGNIEIGVIQMVGLVGVRNVFSTTPLNIATGLVPLFPFLYVNGAFGNMEFGAYNWSANPWTDGQKAYEYTGASDDSAIENGYEDLYDGGMKAGVPLIDVNRFAINNLITTQLRMDKTVWNGLGFTKGWNGGFQNTRWINAAIGENQDPEFTSIWKADGIIEYALSDHFLVVSDSLPLESFDASKSTYGGVTIASENALEKSGRRKNILMTIPINDNTDGVVEFQTNTPIFIDINNAQPMNVKNLNFRILRKDFTSIQTIEESSVLTILISDD